MWPDESGPICLLERARHGGEGPAHHVDQFGIGRGQVGPDPEERRVVGPELRVGLHPAEDVLPLGRRVLDGQRVERVVEGLRLVGRLGHQGAQQVLLVGEVQVEGAVRGLGDIDDVVDPGGVVAPLVERHHGGVEQLAHGAAALASQDPLAGGGADGVAGLVLGVGVGGGGVARAAGGATGGAGALSGRGRRLGAAHFGGAGGRPDPLVGVAGSRRTLGDPMPGAW